MRALVLSTLAAVSLAGAAAADVPPFNPPVEPISAGCESLMGAWQSEVQNGKNYTYTAWLFIDSEGVTATQFSTYGEQFIAETHAASAVSCTPGENGIIALKINDLEPMSFTRTDETTLTEARMTSYMGNGAPDPDWKPEPYTVTWKRVAK